MSTVPDIFDTDPESVANNQNSVESMADTKPRKDVPWADIGTQIPPNASVDTVMDLAGLDWQVIKAPSQLVVQDFKDGQEQTSIIDNKGCYGLVRDSDHTILSPAVGKNYKPVQNRDALQVFRDFVDTGNMTLETAGSLCSGRHIWGLASFGENFELEGGERISGNMLLLQSHRYGFALRVLFTPIRYPGGLTLVRPINVKNKMKTTYRMQHSRKFTADRVCEIHQLMDVARSSFNEFCDQALFMSQKMINEEAAVRYLLTTINPQYLAKAEMEGGDIPSTIEELKGDKSANRLVRKVAESYGNYHGSDGPACKGTAWGLYNTVAAYMDHESGRNVNTRLESVWMGPKAALKQTAFDMAYLTAVQKGASRT